MIPRWDEFHKFQVVVIVWLICAAVCDILITTALTWHLVGQVDALAFAFLTYSLLLVEEA